MPSNYARNLIEFILKSTKNEFKDSHDMMLYQRGYLTGLLASIVDEDFYARGMLERHLKELRGAAPRDRT